MLQTKKYFRGKLTKNNLMIIILKETLDNIGIIGYLGLVKRTWSFDFMNCIECLLVGILPSLKE